MKPRPEKKERQILSVENKTPGQINQDDGRSGDICEKIAKKQFVAVVKNIKLANKSPLSFH